MPLPPPPPPPPLPKYLAKPNNNGPHSAIANNNNNNNNHLNSNSNNDMRKSPVGPPPQLFGNDMNNGQSTIISAPMAKMSLNNHNIVNNRYSNQQNNMPPPPAVNNVTASSTTSSGVVGQGAVINNRIHGLPQPPIAQQQQYLSGDSNNHNNLQPPPPPPPPAGNSGGNTYQQSNFLATTANTATIVPRNIHNNAVPAQSQQLQQQQQQQKKQQSQFRGNVVGLSSLPPPLPAAAAPMMMMSNNNYNADNYNQQQQSLPPPPPQQFQQQMQQQMQQQHQFQQRHPPTQTMYSQPPPLPPSSLSSSYQSSSNQMMMQPPPAIHPPPPPSIQPPATTATAAARPQYNATNSNNNNSSRNDKIDPSQIPRIPLFTRPHHAPATIYPNHDVGNSYGNSMMNGGGSGSYGSGGYGMNTSAPPPPLDSRYVFNSSSNNNHNKNASPRVLSTTVHTFPMDSKTLRSCGNLPLGLICTPLGSLSSLCCTTATTMKKMGGSSNNNEMMKNDDERTATTTTTTSTQWNGREQGDIYADNTTNTSTSNDVDHIIPPSFGKDIIINCSSGDEEEEENDPERIPVIRGPKRSIVVNVDDHQHHHLSSHPKQRSSTTNTTATKITRTITPPRCSRCNAYLNPYCTPSTSTFTSNSSSSSTFTNTFQGLIYKPTQSYNCNMCGTKSSIVITNEEYISSNIFENTSLSFGTVEYEVGDEYCVRKNGFVENVFLYGVEYYKDDLVEGCSYGNGMDDQKHHHHHHGTMQSHGWKESLDAIRDVARELCITSPRREDMDNNGIMVKDVKIGIFAFCQDMLIFPYVKRKDGHNVGIGGERDDDEEELAVAIVSDVTEDPFCPLPLNAWSYNVGQGLESKEWHRFCRVLDSFTELMEQLVGNTSDQSDKWKRNCGGAALAALSDALQNSGGRGTLITTRRPNYGVGALRDRQAVPNYGIGSVSEQKLFTPLQHLVQRNNDAVGIVKDKPAGLFYKKLGEDCARNRVCLDIVVTSSSVSVPPTDPKQLQKNPNMRKFLDVATLGELCRVTCGYFKWLRVGNECGVAVNGGSDTFTGEQLREELKRSALSYSGSDVVFKLRCSSGVQVKSYSPTLPVGTVIGDGIVDSAELELSSMNPGTSIAVILEHKVGGVVDTIRGSSGRKGIDMPMVFFQSAVLYTTKTGQRRVRVSTIGLPTSKVPADVFRSADLGAVSTIFTREAISDVERDGGSLRLARENVFNKCVSILANYRSHTTARSSPSGQLILPESLQLLPLFCLSLRKSRILRHSLPKPDGLSSAKPFPTADERAYHIFYGRMVSPYMSLQCVHPHLFQVSDMRTRDGDWITPPVLQEYKFIEENVIAASMKPVCQLPRTMNPSIACLDESGMYLLDDRFSFYLFIGKDVPEEKWRDLLSVSPQSGALGGTGYAGARCSIPIGGLSLADTNSGHKLRSVIHQLRILNSPNSTLGLTARNTYAPLILVFVGRGSVFEEEMDSLLVDDPDSHEKSYVDFLCDVHRSVREKSEET